MTRGPFKLGLTGSIAMGKTTTVGFFRAAGAPVWDADTVVRRLYSKGGAGVPVIAGLAPDAVANGEVGRDRLRNAIQNDAALLQRIEAKIHPLVAEDRAEFLRDHKKTGTGLVVFDIPLLFETDAQEWLDAVLVVTAPSEIQRARALSRPEMTETLLETILARQLPDEDKQQRADYLLDTSLGLDAARAEVLSLIDKLREAGHA